MECVYLGQPIGEMGIGDSNASLHICNSQRVIADVAINHERLKDQPFEIDAFVKRDGRQMEAKFANCQSCPHRANTTESRPFRMNELRYVTTAQLTEATLSLASVVPRNVAAVAGIPRSGLIPASILATMLKLPLYSLDAEQGLVNVGAGLCRRLTLDDIGGPLLVVDDTVYDGRAMQTARKQLDGADAIYAAIFARRPELVDMYASRLDSPHLCEWNLFQNPVMSGQAQDKRLRGGICFDFDGVLCPNPPGPVTDDWLRRVPPLPYLPTACEIPMIVSMRLEPWRQATVDWLTQYGATCNRIVMAPYQTEAARDADYERALIETKVMPFAESECWMMVESEPEQAELIADIADKPVLCVRDKQIYY